MTDTTTTTNMSLVLPVVSARPGPSYASDVNAALQALDAHSHLGDGYTGKRLTTAALNLDADLPLNSHNVTGVRSLRLDNELATLSGGSDRNCLSAYGGNLYYNNGSGTPVQITNASSVVGAAFTSNVWAAIDTTSNLTISGSDTFVSINVKAHDNINIQLPAASAVTNGRYYVIIDGLGHSESDYIYLIPAGTDGINHTSATQLLSSNYGTWIVRSDGVSNWQLIYTGFSGLTASSLTYTDTVLTNGSLSIGSTPATSGILRAPTASVLASARNAANNGNIEALATNSSDWVLLGDGNTQQVHIQAANGNFVSGDLTLSNNLTIGASKSITIGNSTAITMGTGASITIGNGGGIALGASSGNIVIGGGNVTYASARTAYKLIQAASIPNIGVGGSDAWTMDFTGTTNLGVTSPTAGASLIMPLDPYIESSLNGGTLTAIILHYQIQGVTRNPDVRLMVNAFTNSLDASGIPLSLFSGGAQQVPLYTTHGAPLNIGFAPNQNNGIALATNKYWIVFTDETGSSAIGGNQVRGVTLQFTVNKATL